MNWNPAMLAVHYSWPQIVCQWTLILPLYVAFFMFFTLTLDSLVDLSIRCCYNPKSNWVARGISLCIACPLFVLLLQSITFVSLILFLPRIMSNTK